MLRWENGVMSMPASAPLHPAEGFVRLSFTVADEVLKDACLRIAGFVESLRAGR